MNIHRGWGGHSSSDRGFQPLGSNRETQIETRFNKGTNVAEEKSAGGGGGERGQSEYDGVEVNADPQTQTKKKKKPPKKTQDEGVG